METLIETYAGRLALADSRERSEWRPAASVGWASPRTLRQALTKLRIDPESICDLPVACE